MASRNRKSQEKHGSYRRIFRRSNKEDAAPPPPPPAPAVRNVVRSSGAREFEPNPTIPLTPTPPSSSSSTNTPPKKKWEGAYRNFLGRRSKSPRTSPRSRLHGKPPASPTAACGTLPVLTNPSSPKQRNGQHEFAVLPGSKRLVSSRLSLKDHQHRPQSEPLHKSILTEPPPHIPDIPKITNTSNGEGAVRGGKLFQSVFSRPLTARSGSTGRLLSKSCDDELDAPLRKGVETRSTASLGYLAELHNSSMSPTNPLGNVNSTTHRKSDEEDLSKLDSLLAQASSTPTEPSSGHLSVSLGRATSMQAFPNGAGAVGFGYSHGSTAGFRSSSYGQMSPHVFPHQANGGDASQDQGSACSTNLLARTPESADGHIMPATRALEEQVGLELFHNSSDSNTVHHGWMMGAPSLPSTPERKYESTAETPIPSSGLKKVFTNFHNQARDSTNPFLGDDPSMRLGNQGYMSQNYPVTRTGSMSSFQQHFLPVESQTCATMCLSTSLPMTPAVDDTNVPILDNIRLLRPVEGTDVWQEGRRYLIAPAALAACPLRIVDKLSGRVSQSPLEAACESRVPYGFVDLGQCVMTYGCENHYMTLGKWSSCRLILRQNYLLEYDTATPISGTPRGFCHLQHAVAKSHEQFPDILELQFFASPCSRSDQRKLLIRVPKREERVHWINCLNQASALTIKDLWQYDDETTFGYGRYASVYPAKRKCNHDDDSMVIDNRGVSDNQISEEAMKQYDCALKIVDKKKFWSRVVKGRERADTLVRELSVQSTLAAKCASAPTFLKIKGFFETSDHVVFELELLKGTDLFEYISSKEFLNEDEAARIARDMLLSIVAMNKIGVAHRDIKPANVLMCDPTVHGSNIKIGDFGMSAFVNVDGKLRGRCGTPGYVAPEILTVETKSSYGNSIDVFSAGVTLYVMLCGYEPFYGESEKELIESNREGIIDFPGTEWNNVSEDARDLLNKMMHRDPKERVDAKTALEHSWFRRTHEKTSDGTELHPIKLPPVRPEASACVIS